MAYAVLADMQTRYGADELLALSDRDNSGVADVGVVDAALSDAGMEIDAYLSNRYTLPLASPYPALLVRLCCELARYTLYKDKAPEIVRTGREDAIALLRRIAAGDAKLQVSTDTPTTDKTGDAFQCKTSNRVFSDALMNTMPGVTPWN